MFSDSSPHHIPMRERELVRVENRVIRQHDQDEGVFAQYAEHHL